MYVRNATTSHKKLTYAPTVTAAGGLIDQHVLFSNLVNVPRDVNEQVSVDVNKTGMWSNALTKKWFENVM